MHNNSIYSVLWFSVSLFQKTNWIGKQLKIHRLCQNTENTTSTWTLIWKQPNNFRERPFKKLYCKDLIWFKIFNRSDGRSLEGDDEQ